ncbi:hypothetical protein R1flu_024058 [Riccia fluitans]|uniref:Uncharacterized protein n=1 Tax=Riccia fluitans TaxID=41844 RepID=A0ABD1XTT7_9MARC
MRQVGLVASDVSIRVPLLSSRLAPHGAVTFFSGGGLPHPQNGDRPLHGERSELERRDWDFRSGVNWDPMRGSGEEALLSASLVEVDVLVN